MTYEYACTHCKFTWEEDQSIKDNATTTCPSCKKETAKRLISLSNFILEGSGWARDNYK